MAAFDCEGVAVKLRWELLILALVLCAPSAFGQCCGSIEGRVSNGNGHAVANATVTVSGNKCLGPNQQTMRSRDDGGYGAQMGFGSVCDFDVQAAGFKPVHLVNVDFRRDPFKHLDFTLEQVGPANTISTTINPGLVRDSGSLVASAALANWEYGGLVQGGVGLEERTNFSFILVGGHLGRVLTPEMGTGILKGDFEYSVEVFPFWQSYTPKFQRITCTAPGVGCSAPYTVGGTYTGVSVTPIQMRWNFTHGKKIMPWMQAAGGVLWTNHKYPAVGDLNPADPTQTGPNADTSVWNFTPQGGIGAHYFVRAKRSVDASVNAVHISSASLGDKNPGVNVSLQMSVGYTWWK